MSKIIWGTTSITLGLTKILKYLELLGLNIQQKDNVYQIIHGKTPIASITDGSKFFHIEHGYQKQFIHYLDQALVLYFADVLKQNKINVQPNVTKKYILATFPDGQVQIAIQNQQIIMEAFGFRGEACAPVVERLIKLLNITVHQRKKKIDLHLQT